MSIGSQRRKNQAREAAIKAAIPCPACRARRQARKLNQQAAAAVLARVEACNAHLAAPEPVSGRTEVSVGEHTVA